MIIQQLINLTRNYIGRDDIKDAIITVPSYFNDSQREAIQMSSKISGINVLNIVDEEIAVCYSYKLHKYGKKKNILVFNMRSNETNVTIINLQDSIFNIIGTVKVDNLGGNILNEELIKYCINEFNEKNGIIIEKDSKGYKRLEEICEKCIIDLSYSEQCEIDIDELSEGEDLNITIYRFEFEDICKYLFDKIISLIKEVLKYSYLTKNEIDEIILT